MSSSAARREASVAAGTPAPAEPQAAAQAVGTALLAGPHAVCLTDAQGAILEVNRAFLELYGCQRHELLGRTPRVLKSGRQAPAVYAALWQALLDPARGCWSGELVNRRSDGAEVRVLLSVQAVRAALGGPPVFVGFSVDITRQGQVEAELQAKNRALEELNRLKSDLMAITSHDLKAPLAAIDACAHELRRRIPPHTHDGPGQLLDRVLQATCQMAQLIDCIVDLERMGSGGYRLRPRRVHLEAVLRACVETARAAASRKAVALRYSAEPRDTPFVGDFVKLEQLFDNVLSNAVKFAPEGSTVEVAYVDRGAEKSVRVCDRGPGIPEHDLENIFDRYFQVARKGSVPQRGAGSGTGLGLAISKGIVELHGGRIRASNRPEGGCCFEITLPARRVLGLDEAMAVLAVDPQGTLTPLLEQSLRRRGLELFATRNLPETRRVYEYERPELVFCHRTGPADEVLDFLLALPARHAGGPLLVCVDDDEAWPAPATGLRRTLPLAEVEVLEILKEARMQPRPVQP